MPQTEITVQFVNAAKPGKKYGSVKTSEGNKFLAKTPILSMFGPGQVCMVSYHSETWGQEQVNIIDTKIGGQPAPEPAQKPLFRARTATADSKQIFVTALLKEYIAAGKLETSKTAVVTLGNALKEAYEDLFGTSQMQVSQEQMQDEIPY